MNSSNSPTTASQSISSTRLEQQIQQLQEEIAQLRQENEQLRQSEARNQQVSLLTTIAEVANLLLRSQDYTTVLPDVVRLLGEAVGSDRCAIGQDQGIHPTFNKLFLTIDVEWCKSGVLNSRKFSPHPDQVYLWEDVPYIYEKLRQGEVISCLVADLPEPDRSIFGAQGCTSALIVPILINNKLRGEIGFDNCGQPRLYDEAEIAILKVAADSIAAAIERQAKEDELLRVEQERSQELERLNTELQQALDRLTESEQRYRQIMGITGEGILRVEYDQPISLDLPIDEQLQQIYQHCRLAEHNLALAQMYGYDQPDALVGARLSDFHVMDDPVTIANMTQFVRDGWCNRNMETVEVDRFGQKRHFLNNTVTQFKDRCAISAWVTQIDITELRATQQALLQAEQERSTDLERHNAELQQMLDRLQAREQLLETSAIAAKNLLTREDFDEAINAALQIIGTSLDTDRVTVIEFFQHPSTPLPHWRVLYEWDSPGTLSQIAHPDLAQGTHEGMEDLYDQLRQGQTVSCLLDELPETFRSEQTLLGAKQLYEIPIFVEGKLWGIIGFDDCREATQRSLAELSVLKIAANCIGSAIQQQRTQKAILQAEQARSQELERLNAELQQTLDRLSESEERYRTLFEISSEGIFRFEFARPIPLNLPVDEQVELIYQNLSIVEANITFAQMFGYEHPEDLVSFRLTDLHIEASQQNHVMMRSVVEKRYQIRNAETEEVDRYGNPRYFLNNISTLIKDGCAIGGWASQLDITELRLAQQALLQAEQDRVAELAKANDALKQTVDALATETDLNHFLGHVLKVIAEQLDAPLTEYWYHPEPNNIAYVGLTYWQEKILKPEEQSGHVGLFGYPVPPEMIQQESPHHRRRHFITEDIASSEVHSRIAHEYGLDAGAWYQSRGVNRFLNMPLILGDRTIGALIVFLPSDRHFTEQQIELTYALAQQVTLAIQLTRLAEEAKQAAILEDRNRMAREIHDTLAQSFAGILMQLQAATLNLIDDPEQVIVHLKRASHLTREGLAEARRSVSLLLQEDAAYSDLLSSLHQLVEQMGCNTDVPISVNVEGTPYPLNPEMGMHLFRMVQESLNNALRHADPSMIQINLSYVTQKVSLCIQDDGHGFDLEQPTNGFGLKGMQQRADLLNAQLQINSQIDVGTEVHITAPTHPS